MIATAVQAPPRVAEMLSRASCLTTVEQLMLAKLLLDNILIGEPDEEANWSAMSLETFQRDWDNAEDTIYDDWRRLYICRGT